MKNTQSIKEKLAGLATQSPEEQVKVIAEITGLLESDNNDYDDLKKRHDTLIVDYGKLATARLSDVDPKDKEEDPKPKVKTDEEIIEEILKGDKK